MYVVVSEMELPLCHVTPDINMSLYSSVCFHALGLMSQMTKWLQLHWKSC